MKPHLGNILSLVTAQGKVLMQGTYSELLAAFIDAGGVCDDSIGPFAGQVEPSRLFEDAVEPSPPWVCNS